MAKDFKAPPLKDVARPCYVRDMAGTTTVRLDDEDEAILALLSEQYGGRSSVIRHALKALAADHQRKDGLRSFLDEWVEDVSNDEVAAMTERFGL